MYFYHSLPGIQQLTPLIMESEISLYSIVNFLFHFELLSAKRNLCVLDWNGHICQIWLWNVHNVASFTIAVESLSMRSCWEMNEIVVIVCHSLYMNLKFLTFQTLWSPSPCQMNETSPRVLWIRAQLLGHLEPRFLVVQGSVAVVGYAGTWAHRPVWEGTALRSVVVSGGLMLVLRREPRSLGGYREYTAAERPGSTTWSSPLVGEAETGCMPYWLRLRRLRLMTGESVGLLGAESHRSYYTVPASEARDPLLAQ